MKMMNCAHCGDAFSGLLVVGGKKISAYNRKFCLSCSPVGGHNTRSNINNAPPSFIDRLSKEEFIEIINKSRSRTDFFRLMDMTPSGGSFSILNRRIARDNIDISHFMPAIRFRRSLALIPYKDILIENSSYLHSGSLKKRLLKDKLLKNECFICQNNGTHNGKTLVLHLDHINGNRKDNRIENLRMLCPNCHSQTDTYCGKSKKQT